LNDCNVRARLDFHVAENADLIRRKELARSLLLARAIDESTAPQGKQAGQS
jgi:hypothetical protein